MSGPVAAFSPYSTRTADLVEDRGNVLAIWHGNLGEQVRMEHKFHWFYEQAPTGAPLTILLEWRASAEAAPVPIGVATAGRRDFLLGREPLRAGVLVDMAVRTEHRSLGPALQLQKKLLADGLQAAAFLYGFPNPKAAPVFQRAGYRRLGLMRRHVLVVRASGYLRRFMPALLARGLAPLADGFLRLRMEWQAWTATAPSLKWGSIVDAAMDSAGSHPEGVALLLGARSREFLVWRFAGGLPGRFRLVVPAQQPAAGYWVVEELEGVLQVLDCAPSLLHESGRAAWLALFRDAARNGCSSVSFECLAPEALRANLAALGMRVRSERPVFLAAATGVAESLEKADWFLTSADEDE